MNFLVVLLGVGFLLFISYVIYKKPEIIKKDKSKPFSLKNFSIKKTFIGDWKSFFTWGLLMFIVWGYAHDTSACREIVYNIEDYCVSYVAVMNGQVIPGDFNFKLNITGGEYNQTNKPERLNQSGGSNIISSDSEKDAK